jgi:Ser/Thr protein kinase RdoA (MazF antagonist)
MAGGAANTSYKITSHEDQFVLTVLDNTSHLKFPVEVLPETLHHLNAHGVLTNQPCKGSNGRFVQTIRDHTVMLKTFLSGRCYDVLPEELLANAGKALGRLHAVRPATGLPTGARRLRNAEDFLPKFDDQEFADWVRKKLDEADNSLPLATGGSIVHGDYASDNLIITETGEVAIIDWETASLDDPMIDVGWAIVGLCCVNGQLDHERRAAFLDGYELERPFTDDERIYIQPAAVYAATVLGFYRYVRQHIRFPNPSKFDIYREMWRVAEDIEDRW